MQKNNWKVINKNFLKQPYFIRTYKTVLSIRTHILMIGEQKKSTFYFYFIFSVRTYKICIFGLEIELKACNIQILKFFIPIINKL